MGLFAEQGFADTTVADIAARAGLTQRTFFRYFEDKREVLFSGSERVQAAFVGAIAAAPRDAAPLDAIAIGLDAIADIFVGMDAHPRKRQALIAANPELQERELIKLATLADAGAAALRERGVAEPGAGLAAQAGVAVLRSAFERWTEGPKGQDLHALFAESLVELRAVAA